jgi:3-oxoacyl-[acyl-carrier protein] reductase
VTGGWRGIGAAIAKRLADDGAAVAITYASTSQKPSNRRAGEPRRYSRRHRRCRGSEECPSPRRFGPFGRLDVLINNAGIAIVAPVGELSLEDFDRTVAVNVRGVFVAAQEASRHMGEGGHIIKIGSVNADRMPFAGGSVYAMSKAAVAGLTHGLARDLGPRGITVNDVQPGPVDTDLNPADGPFADLLKGYLAIARYGSGEDVAALVSYLAGPKAG